MDQLYDMFWYTLVADAVETLISPRYNLKERQSRSSFAKVWFPV